MIACCCVDDGNDRSMQTVNAEPAVSISPACIQQPPAYIAPAVVAVKPYVPLAPVKEEPDPYNEPEENANQPAPKVVAYGEEFVFKFTKKGALGVRCKKGTATVVMVFTEHCVGMYNAMVDSQLQLKPGDTVVAINGRRNLEGATLMKAAMNVEGGKEVEFTCIRG